METILSEIPIRWYRTKVNKTELNALLERSDLQGWTYVFTHLALLVTSGGIALTLASTGQYAAFAIACLVHGCLYSFLGWAGAGHELSHRTVFRTRALNEFFLRLFSIATWSNHIYFNASHTKHHLATTFPGRDGEVVLPQRVAAAQWFWALWIDVPALLRTIQILVENSFGVVRGEWGNQLFPVTNQRARKKLALAARAILVAQLVGVAVFLFFGLWQLVILVTLAPFIGTAPNRLLALAQHYGKRSGVADFRENSRTLLLLYPVSRLYWHMNYHIEHHMFSAVPCYNLSKLHSLIAHDTPAPTRGVFQFLKQYYAATWLQE